MSTGGLPVMVAVSCGNGTLHIPLPTAMVQTTSEPSDLDRVGELAAQLQEQLLSLKNSLFFHSPLPSE